MRFIVKLQEHAQPILKGQTGNIPGKTNCHILEPAGEPSFYMKSQRLFSQYQSGSIKYCHVCGELRTSPVYNVKYVAHEVVHTPWLFGPASLRNKTLIYPCENFQCQIGCPCKICRGLLTTCQDLEEHMIYHRAPHTMCKFCDELAKLIPNNSWQIVYKNVYYSGVVPQFKKYDERMGSASLFKHYRVEILPSSKQRPISCDKCELKFQSIYHLKRHEISVHYKLKVTYPHCGLQMTRRDNLEDHNNNVHGSGMAEKYKCDICLKTFDKKANYTRHKKTGKTNCSICAELFCTLKQLQQHRMEHHPMQLKCQYCNKTFNFNSHLKRHVIGRIAVKCEKCEECFCNYPDLKMHQNNEHARITNTTCTQNIKNWLIWNK